jgi:PEP-CTERM motif
MHLNFHLRIAVLCLGLGAGAESAAIVTFYGADNGAAPGDTFTFSNAARDSFVAAAGAGSVITFEGQPTNGTPTNPVAPGVTLTVSGNATGSGGIQNTNQHTPTPVGFNTTPGGSKWLQMFPDFNSSGASAIFDFANPIAAFGFFLSDTQEGFPGEITVEFDDGTAQSLSFQKTSGETGGVLFFGFTTDPGQSFNSVTINTGQTSGLRDIFGIDDVRFVTAVSTVPEPATLALLGFALVGLAASRRRKR